jgi:hypothetical protein
MTKLSAPRLRQGKAGRCSQCGCGLGRIVFVCEDCGHAICMDCVRIEGPKFYCLDCWQARWVG